jgi:glycosyltransferase involved in cell wall biosynthesis
MNVLCLDQFGELGGAQRCLLDLLPALAERGWKAHVAVPDGGALAERAVALNATADQIHCGPYRSGHKTSRDAARLALQTPRLVSKIRTLVRDYDADLLYINGPRLLPAAALAVRNRPPMLFHAHSYLEGSARWIAGISLLASRAAVVATCRFVASPLLRYCRERRAAIVYNGVRQTAAPSRIADGPEFRIGVVGRISPEKGQVEFIKAARLLYQDSPNCRFVICGAPLFSNPAAVRYREEVERLAEGLPCEFSGWKEDIGEVLGGLNLLVVPSAHVDATPRVILEAFAAGVPVVAFASGGIPEIVEHNRTGVLVEPRSPGALAAAIRHALREPHWMRQMAERALIKVRGEFSLERYREQMLETIQAAVRS